MATEPRLSEAVRAYRDLGFEVVLLPAKLADLEGQHCTECLADAYGIYTRPARRSQGDQGETS